MDILACNRFFFVGIAGTGMSAIAQYLNGVGKTVGGSDREFGKAESNATQTQFEGMGLQCFPQDASGVTTDVDVLVISTAIEPSNIEYKKAESLGIPIVKRSEVLAAICNAKRTIAVGGTSGKSTTTAMIFHILETAGEQPSLITGAGLSSLQRKGLPGNAWVGESDLLVIEADESDGSIVGYKPEIGLLLNVDRDHHEYDELLRLFSTFKANTKSAFIVNQDYKLTKELSQSVENDFGTSDQGGFVGSKFQQKGFTSHFLVNGLECQLQAIGRHNMENALAAISASVKVGVSLEDAISAISSYEGIYRRTQLVGEKNGITVVDDFAHNPAEVVAAIKACQNIGTRVFAWFQPHGFGPLRFMHEELSEMLIDCLRENDVALLSNVYYAGGTVNQDINSDIVTSAVAKEKTAVFIPERVGIIDYVKEHAKSGDVVLLMGARDPYLAQFAEEVLAGL